MNIKKYIYQKAAANHIPISGTFELTPRCNLSCEMCYIRMTAEEQGRIGRELTTEEWLTIARDAVDAGMVYLLLTGGEPMLRKDFTKLYEGIAELGVMLSLNTNGTLLNDEILHCLKQHPPERVNVTLYGAAPETYAAVCGNAGGYNAALRGIRMLHENAIPVCVNVTLTRHNAADMERIIACVKEIGVPVRMTSYLFPTVRCMRECDKGIYLTPEEYGKLAATFDHLTMTDEQMARRLDVLQRIQKKTEQEKQIIQEEGRAGACMAGRGAFWITWDGKMLPCGMLPELSQDVRSDGFGRIWQETGACIADKTLPQQCAACVKKIVCPVCLAVTQCGREIPTDLCRFTDSYIASMLEKD